MKKVHKVDVVVSQSAEGGNCTLRTNMSTHLFGLIVSWCSGSTVSFGLTRGGSNPSETTNYEV